MTPFARERAEALRAVDAKHKKARRESNNLEVKLDKHFSECTELVGPSGCCSPQCRCRSIDVVEFQPVFPLRSPRRLSAASRPGCTGT